jgi:hypothetical protein
VSKERNDRKDRKSKRDSSEKKEPIDTSEKETAKEEIKKEEPVVEDEPVKKEEEKPKKQPWYTHSGVVPVKERIYTTISAETQTGVTEETFEILKKNSKATQIYDDEKRMVNLKKEIYKNVHLMPDYTGADRPKPRGESNWDDEEKDANKKKKEYKKRNYNFIWQEFEN